MPDKDTDTTDITPRAGSGFAVAALFGTTGLGVAAVLWGAGAALWLVLAAYLLVPAAMLAGLYYATGPAPRAAVQPARRLRKERPHA
ncbi:hypothetical protein [Salipiger mangrovisoli]|uniref:Uncharacterized protein n=1 Tax=Salipiger mangrovisoli TaxID=2865933 RepID=A0ABR9X5G5_9RHOB|nr:hypothetical protein [Salipiger mangrovisoli]MBE9638687.1 hypothetical protein [Salipiger mangrovisoli]